MNWSQRPIGISKRCVNGFKFNSPGNWRFRIPKGQRELQLTSEFYTSQYKGNTKETVYLGIGFFQINCSKIR